MNKSYMN